MFRDALPHVGWQPAGQSRMSNSEITNFVVSQLGKHRSVDDVTRMLVSQTELNWGDAKKLVQRIQFERRNEITTRQAPWVLMVGVLTIIAGLAISAVITWATLNGVIIFFLVFPMPYLGNLVYFGIGILMALGGIVGILRLATQR